MNAREISYRLNESQFDVIIFYLKKPDPRLIKDNIKLIKVPQYNGEALPFITLSYYTKHLFDHADVLFFPRGLRGYLYLILKNSLIDKKKTIFSVENVMPFPGWGWFEEFLQRFHVNMCDYVYSNSKYVAETVKTYFGKSSKVIYTGVDTNIFVPPKKSRFFKNRVQVLYVGSFQTRKRPQLILEAARCFPNVDFTLIGSGPMQNSLFEMKRSMKLDNVTIRPPIPLDSLVASLQHSDVFLFPSMQEGFPKVTIEAAATGLPAIVFDNYKPETVINGETGFIVGDFDEMISKLKLLIENLYLRKQMGERARKYAQQFDWNQITRQWEAEFVEIIGEK
ncbi:MAG: glycosyltransferase family 4 protein [Candidatus Bathyarchaeia archaeon]